NSNKIVIGEGRRPVLSSLAGRLPEGRGGVRPLHQDPHSLHDLRMASSQVARLAGVLLEVVQLDRTSERLADAFPISHPGRLRRAALVELPVEELVLLLLPPAEE